MVQNAAAISNACCQETAKRNLECTGSMQRRISFIFGTRPEAIKLCPLVTTLRSHPDFRPHVCVTGQHREMLVQVLDAFLTGTVGRVGESWQPSNAIGWEATSPRECLSQFVNAGCSRKQGMESTRAIVAEPASQNPAVKQPPPLLGKQINLPPVRWRRNRH